MSSLSKWLKHELVSTKIHIKKGYESNLRKSSTSNMTSGDQNTLAGMGEQKSGYGNKMNETSFLKYIKYNIIFIGALDYRGLSVFMSTPTHLLTYTYA